MSENLYKRDVKKVKNASILKALLTFLNDVLYIFQFAKTIYIFVRLLA
ncbi:hypothetical protein HMPREF1127_1028 [Fusobacterium necrophorum subsp. funduliforme Fnf 1007]|uniref:Uncharacterized protein n=1 Tax=Fusobacterium necrophorum subsp. funduliforme Fnf 1007 TaxID=1161424 RepID=A0AAN3VVV0_9FUSO|nr:hypothetical protein HMPREF1127_1028 [Fusobacterium necrophorum subsp. funduliforme Fnf 1007]